MFNEKEEEYYKGRNLPVWQSPKYEQSKKKALEIIKEYDRITEADFWILMNTYRNGEKMMYSGLIISHNGCLKINDSQAKDKQFIPSAVTLDKDGYKGSLVYTYMSDEQGIYEVGEVSEKNCKNDYPYAMAYKRLFDRVVLKLCGLAYDGVYSDSEADEFKQKYTDPEEEQEQKKMQKDLQNQISKTEALTLEGLIISYGAKVEEVCSYYKVANVGAMSKEQYADCVKLLDMKYGKKDKGTIGNGTESEK